MSVVTAGECVLDGCYVCSVGIDVRDLCRGRSAVAPVPYLDMSEPKRFTAYEINNLPLTGINVNGLNYVVSAPLVETPKYVTKCVIDAMNTASMGCSSVVLFPKWDGIRAVSVLCESRFDAFSLRFIGPTVTKCLAEPPCVYEHIEGDCDRGLDGVTKINTFLLNDVGELANDHYKIDGIVCQHENVQYRLKYRNTYDLERRADGFVTSDGFLVFAAKGEAKMGRIFELDTQGVVVRERQDKCCAQSISQVVLIRDSPVYKQLEPVLQNMTFGYSVQYHLSVYVWYLYTLGVLASSPTLSTVVVALRDTCPPYSFDEILLNAKEHVLKASGRAWTLNRGDMQSYVFVLIKYQPLTVEHFLVSRAWIDATSYSSIKKKLLSCGFYFTNCDLTLLMRKYIRQCDNKFYVVINHGYKLKLFKQCAKWAFETELPIGQLLPYHAAIYNPKFFDTVNYFDVLQSPPEHGTSFIVAVKTPQLMRIEPLILQNMGVDGKVRCSEIVMKLQLGKLVLIALLAGSDKISVSSDKMWFCKV